MGRTSIHKLYTSSIIRDKGDEAVWANYTWLEDGGIQPCPTDDDDVKQALAEP